MQVNIQEGIIAEVHRFMTLDRVDAARRFLLQCLIAKDFLEEVFL